MENWSAFDKFTNLENFTSNQRVQIRPALGNISVEQIRRVFDDNSRIIFVSSP